MPKTYDEINQKIKERNAKIITAEEMVALVEKEGLEYAADKIDVVTTGTFGCMCSSGAFLNIPQPNPPIIMDNISFDGIPAYHGGAAADCYLGVTQKHETYPEKKIGGGHILEKLLSGDSVSLSVSARGTDCYPRTALQKEVNLDTFNQAILLNPRNGYQRYVCAVNTSDAPLYTYMGKLLPNLRNGTFGGVGTLSPLNNDPTYQTIGLGTPIFLGGGIGHIIGEGTQHSPQSGYGNLMVKGDLKGMDPEFLCGASITNYGVSCFIGLGIPIPVLNDSLAKSCSIPDEEIMTSVTDYSTGTRDRPTLREVSYGELKTREIEVDGKIVPVSSTSSIPKSRAIAKMLQKWIEGGDFLLNAPVRTLSTYCEYKSMDTEVIVNDE